MVEPQAQPARSRIPAQAIDAIPGWMQRSDMLLFRMLLEEGGRRLDGGDVAELGAYLGKSAALIGWCLEPEARFTVVDLFEQDADEEDNQAENEEQYAELSQEAFERNYLTVNDALPNVVRGPSSSVLDHATHGTHRFVHVDASHLFEHVEVDIASARTLLKPGGVVAFDDYRAVHTPGVAAAIWRATTQDLRPFAITMNKLYACFDDTVPWFEIAHAWVEASYWRPEVQQVAGHDLVRVRRPAPKKTEEPASPHKRWWRRG